MRSIIVLLAVLACAAASAGEVYKWKDKDGRVHYGDKPKEGEAQAVTVESSSGTGDPSKAGAEQASRDGECKTKKQQLEAWRRAPSLSEIDSLGKQREYSAAEREQFLAMTQQKVDGLCAPKAPSPQAAGTFPPPEAPIDEVKAPPDEAPPKP